MPEIRLRHCEDALKKLGVAAQEPSADGHVDGLKARVRHCEDALKKLDIVFCEHCGKPHLTTTRSPATTHSHIYLTREGGAAGRYFVPVCMDDPVAARCFLAMINRRELDADGRVQRVQYRRLAWKFASWVLETGTFAAGHPYQGFVHVVMAGETVIDPDELLFSIAYWFNGVPIFQAENTLSIRQILDLCGVSLHDDEYQQLMQKCLDYALLHKHKGQVAFFTSQLLPVVPAWLPFK